MARDRSQVIGLTLANAWLVVLVIADIAVPGAPIVLAPLFALAPLIAAAVLPGSSTAVYAVLTVLAGVGSGWWNDTWGSPQQTVRVVDIILVSVAAVVISIVRVRREQRHERVSAIAEVAQRTILPILPRQVGEVGIGVRYLSAAEDAVVGGDLYDCYHSAEHVRFLVGDVRGKGVAAVEQAARVIRAFRQAAATRPTLAGVAEEMSAYLAPFFDDEEFVTALLVDTSVPHSLEIVSCGHPPALLADRDGRASLLEAPAGLPLGLGDRYVAVTVPWQEGDRLLMYTDGLSEARDDDGEFLPVEMLAPVVGQGTVEEALDELLESVRRHVVGGRMSDDLAVVLLEHTASDSRPAMTPKERADSEVEAASA